MSFYISKSIVSFIKGNSNKPLLSSDTNQYMLAPPLIPGVAHKPARQITLLVTFQDRENFLIEHCLFEVVDFPMVYNTLQGRPQIHSL